jgi:hypothetical protein
VTDRDTAEAEATLSHASRAEHQARASSRWYARYMLLMAVWSVGYILVIELFFPSGMARLVASGAWGGALGLLAWWAESHHVHPVRGTHRLLVAAAVWFASYLFVIGPIVRWKAGTSLGWWSLAAAVMASPFLIGAWRQRKCP